ncbi:hypothetical protein [Confluentibacter flavum]|uniref:Uncharacterized protein n=1 Tax=Confluentibacter flavum TaxID=1909700 RepID=A0A2N3HN03_9FLAO|nr:hypothetical protein [Confluentibacter flavum]PKQ46302.1 hypothetical protein CSW08_03835 [Confluentibacter flavum]
MKNVLAYSLLLILTFSCNSNDFSDTEMYFQTDKEAYRLNDDFEITVVIFPKNGENKIRIFKKFNNLKISFHLKNSESEFSQELKKHFIEGPSLTGDDSKYIDEYTISQTQPFKKSFKGTISENEGIVVFKIPELNISESIEKSELFENPEIIITGNCHTVYSSIQEDFIPKDIKILID